MLTVRATALLLMISAGAAQAADVTALPSGHPLIAADDSSQGQGAGVPDSTNAGTGSTLSTASPS